MKAKELKKMLGELVFNIIQAKVDKCSMEFIQDEYVKIEKKLMTSDIKIDYLLELRKVIPFNLIKD